MSYKKMWNELKENLLERVDDYTNLDNKKAGMYNSIYFNMKEMEESPWRYQDAHEHFNSDMIVVITTYFGEKYYLDKHTDLNKHLDMDAEWVEVFDWDDASVLIRLSDIKNFKKMEIKNSTSTRQN